MKISTFKPACLILGSALATGEPPGRISSAPENISAFVVAWLTDPDSIFTELRGGDNDQTTTQRFSSCGSLV
nr:hypothetical protein BgiMline_018507 [Biomphalaria glabrata]